METDEKTQKIDPALIVITILVAISLMIGVILIASIAKGNLIAL